MSVSDLIKQLGRALRLTSAPAVVQPGLESTPVSGPVEGPDARDER
jgi:hypothetical protein